MKRQNPTPTQQRNIATGTNTQSPFTGVPTCVLAPESMQGPYCKFSCDLSGGGLGEWGIMLMEYCRSTRRAN